MFQSWMIKNVIQIFIKMEHSIFKDWDTFKIESCNVKVRLIGKKSWRQVKTNLSTPNYKNFEVNVWLIVSHECI